MTLKEKQIAFTRMVPRLIDMAFELGFEVTLGDAYRDPRCPYGSKTSKHHDRLAVDLNLFDRETGEYLRDCESHRCLGEWWERQGGVWGGRAYNGDGNHYEYGNGLIENINATRVE